MCVICKECGYDSGDFESSETIAANVNGDGGHMVMAYSEDGKPKGWDISCPAGHTGDSIHLD